MRTRSKILIVEDEFITAADLETELRGLGYDVAGCAGAGEDALRIARECQPDLALMDIMLKGSMDGIETAARLRDEFSMPVIFLTANSDESILERAKVSEPFGYLLKPFEQRILRTNIEMALYKARMERERAELTRQLQEALAQVRTLRGLLPICAWCKSVRDDDGYWKELEEYVSVHTEAQFSHGLCPKCAEQHFPTVSLTPRS